MISNQVIGRSFKGALSYVFGKAGAELLFSNIVHGPDSGINKMTSEFLAVSSQRPNLSRSVAHIQMSANQKDDISDEKWKEIAEHWMTEMGYQDCLFTVAKHSDTDNDHIHIVASRVDLNGGVVSDSNNYARNLKISRELEKKFGLEVTIPGTDGGQITPKWQRDKTLPPNDYMKEAIKMVGASQPSLPDFIQGLKEIGIDAEVKFSSGKGIPQGISFRFDNYSTTGSKIGFSLKKIEQKLGVTYEPGHREIIERNQNRDAEVSSLGNGEVEAAEQPGITEPKEPVNPGEPGADQPGSDNGRSILERIKSAADYAGRLIESISKGREATNDSITAEDALVSRAENIVEHSREVATGSDRLNQNCGGVRERLGKILKLLGDWSSPAMTKKRALGRVLKAGAGKESSVSLKPKQ